jgi:hypothetical protein
MYSEASIDKLSAPQIRKLLKGGAVRVRAGTAHKLQLSTPQLKKLASAQKKGKMTTLTMDPYQCDMHGKGIFDNVGRFFTQQLPSTLIHQGIPEAGAVLGGVAGSKVGGPVGGLAGSKLGRMAGQELAQEVGRKTGRGTRLEDQSFTLRDVADTGRKLVGRGTRLEDQPFTLRDVADTGRKLVGRGRPRKGQGIMEDMMKLAKPVAKKVAKNVARKASSYVLHEVLPQASAELGQLAGEKAGIAGGREAGSYLGRLVEQEVARRTGLGIKKGGALRVAGA